MTARDLTTGEIKLARLIFKKSIDYRKVKVHNRKYIFFQPGNSGMTPNGEIYIDGIYSDDYSKMSSLQKGFLVHELVHVWQYQLDILNPVTAAIAENISHGFDYTKAYMYTLDADKDLIDYDIEQQAAIIEDYYLVHHASSLPVKGHMQNKLSDVLRDQLFKKVLQKFLINPGYARHILKCRRKRHGSGGHRRMVCRKVLQP